MALVNAGACWVTIDNKQPVARNAGVLAWTLCAVLLTLGYFKLGVFCSIVGIAAFAGAHASRYLWRRREGERQRKLAQQESDSLAELAHTVLRVLTAHQKLTWPSTSEEGFDHALRIVDALDQASYQEFRGMTPEVFNTARTSTRLYVAMFRERHLKG